MSFDLSKAKILSFEIGEDCNLKKIHDKCPINKKQYDKRFGSLTTEKIIQSIEEAQKLGFAGYVAFHHYNEPLLYLDRILEIINAKKDCKYLLWTNGTLLSRNVEENDFLNEFDKIIITCYNENNRPFFEKIKEHYKNVYVGSGALDDRLECYSSDYINEIACKRVLFEIPIDYYGSVHLCTTDWNNTHKIGNINETSFEQVILGEAYQSLVRNAKKRLLDRDFCPDICKRCKEPYITLKLFDDKKVFFRENKS
ncbi:MAG: SPASM domain-containing protein [Halanaerobiales bacterium]|nr:SPASM domain-containing protein [Halanaerobiales bacterium]